MGSLRIDHVIYGVRDLAAAARKLEDEHGLVSRKGGRHPGHGTANRIVPLGAEYLELLGVVDPEEARDSAFGSGILAATAGGDRLVGWAVGTDDLRAHAQRLSLAVTPMSRTTPDGTELRWDVAGVTESVAEPYLPFFIQWHVPAELHPGRGADPETHGIAWLELGADAGRVADWLGEHAMPVRIAGAGGPPLAAVGIRAAGREIALR